MCIRDSVDDLTGGVQLVQFQLLTQPIYIGCHFFFAVVYVGMRLHSVVEEICG